MTELPIMNLFPLNSEVDDQGHLVIGGCDAVALAAEFGTPLYVFDEAGLRNKCREFRDEFDRCYTDTLVAYAGKAFLARALVGILQEEGLSLDAVSAGELNIARVAGFPPERVYFNGSNKTAPELKYALGWGVGRIVVDNLYELAMLDELAGGMGCAADILLRVAPAIDPHTHRYIATGVLDTKFGFPLSGVAEAVKVAMASANLNLEGLHFHVGSLIPDAEPYEQAIDVVLNLAAEMAREHGFALKELNVGGGFAVQYTQDCPVPPVSYYAEAIAARITARCQELDLAKPRLVVEPGRAIVGQAGVALYTVGAIKDVPGVRRYVSVDGGMADNIRPALYGARYEAVLASRMNEAGTEQVTIAGKFCESGDILVTDALLPPAAPGDIVAIPDCGAYCLPMVSNYNAALRPAVVLVKGGEARLIRRRETLEDLIRNDVD